MKALLVLAAMISLSACVTAPMKPRDATMTTIPVSKKKAELISAMTATLAKAGWRIKIVDANAGIISTEPKEFAIPRGILSIPAEARTSLQVLHLGDTAQIQLTHECRYQMVNYYNNTTYDNGYSACYSHDSEAEKVLPSHEAAIIEIVRGALEVKTASK